MSKKLVKIAGITREQFQKVYDRVLSRGLSNGVCDTSNQNVCIEAAVCIATGQTPIEQFELLIGELEETEDLELDDSKFSDEPECVHETLRELKITLNDHGGWNSDADRAKALYDIGIAQLGTKGIKNFGRRFRKGLLAWLEAYDAKEEARIRKEEGLKDSYTLDQLLEDEDLTSQIQDLRYELENQNRLSEQRLDNFEGLVDDLNNHNLLGEFISAVVDILRELKSPGIVWLDEIKREKRLAANRRKAAKKKSKRRS
jgi:hypothetical protein